MAIGAAHHRFNYIRPFPDGNGRRDRDLPRCRLLRRLSGGGLNRSTQHLHQNFLLGFHIPRFAWPFVDPTRHLIQMGLRVRRQVGSLRKVLHTLDLSVYDKVLRRPVEAAPRSRTSSAYSVTPQRIPFRT